MDAAAESQPMTCRECLQYICKKRNKTATKIVKLFDLPKTLTFNSLLVNFLKYPSFIFAICNYIKLGLIICLWSGEKGKYHIVFDASIVNFKNQKCIFLNKSGKLLRKKSNKKCFKDINFILMINTENFNAFPQNVVNFDSLVNYIKMYNSDVNAYYIISNKPPFWKLVYKSKTFTTDKMFICIDRNSGQFKFYIEKEKNKIDDKTEKEKIEPNFKSINNRKSSIFIKESGLNLAKRLGIISQEEFKAVSNYMALFVGCLTFTTTKANKISALQYKDHWASFSCQIPQEWDRFFIFLEKRISILNKLKLSSCSFILKRLEHFKICKINSLYLTCYNSILKHCNRFQCFTFDVMDLFLHFLKIPLVTHYKKLFPKSNKSAFLKYSKTNDLLAISCRKITFINITQIVGVTNCHSFKKTHQVLKECCKNWSWCEIKKNNAVNLYNLYQSINNFLLTEFNYDISMAPFISMAHLSNCIFWQLYLKNSQSWLIHPIEQTLQNNINQLRPFCQGGYSYSAKCQMSAGNYFNRDMIKSIVNYDIVSSYGYACSKMNACGGFGSTFENGKRLETSQRYKFFEFRAVYYTIYKWQNLNLQLLATYHNYSPLGVFYIGKYPIDLVGIFKDGSIKIVQFDSAFCHGCDCCILKRYADNKTQQELYFKTKERDTYTRNWIEKTRVNATYHIYTDCCNVEYNKTQLNLQFKNVQTLSKLIAGYSSIVSDNLDNVHSKITFIAIVKLINLSNDSTFGPIFHPKDKILLTKDYHQFLKSTFPFVKIEKIYWVVFYKKDEVINLVYESLLAMKLKAKGNRNVFLKSVINLSCGYFGSNPDKNQTKYIRLTNKCPQNFQVGKHSVYDIQENENEKKFFIVRTKHKRKKQINNCSSSLVHFCTIIEYGKMRLAQIFHFYQNNFQPDSFIILYANIDSTIFAFTDSSIENIVKNNNFSTNAKEYFNDNQPGKLKLIWHFTLNDNWNFISYRNGSYAITTNHFSIAKMSNVTNETVANIFKTQKQLLTHSESELIQTRKINKLVGPDTKNVCMIFKNCNE